MKRWRLALSVNLLFLATLSYCQDGSQYDSVAPNILFDRSWHSSSVSEKLIIRAFLAEKYQDSPFGLFGKAWITSNDGKSADAESLYLQCIDRYRTFMPCIINAGLIAEDPSEQLRLMRMAVDTDPTYDDFTPITDLYFHYANDVHDQAAANSFLLNWKQQYPTSYIWTFIQAQAAETRNDYKGSEQLYEAAATLAPDNVEVVKRLCRLRVSHLLSPSANESEREAALKPAFTFMTDHAAKDRDKAYEIVMFMADLYRYDFKGSQFILYDAAFKLRPTGEAAEGAANAKAMSSTQDAYQYLKTAAEQLPNNYVVLQNLAFFTNNQQEAAKYYEDAVNNSPSPGERVKTILYMVSTFTEDRLLDFAEGQQRLEALLKQPLYRYRVINQLLTNRLEAADFAGAKRVLKIWEQEPEKPNSNYLLQENSLVDYYLANEERRNTFYKENPFLLYWQQTFGSELKTVLSFELDSSTLEQSDHSNLHQASQLITAKGGDGYIFSVEGYADLSEHNGDKLALRRAEAVVDYLVNEEHIPRERLSPAGGGTRYPATFSRGEDAKAENRRVEIVPVGNLTSPQIVATSAIPSGGFAVSPDARVYAIGDNPIQLWDAASGARVKTLGIGGSPRFSPNGRYLASISEYTLPGNFTFRSLSIDDVKTGIRLIQQPLFYSSGGLAWSPDGSKLAYVNDKPQLCIYDIAMARRTSCTPTPGKRIVGSVLWTRDNKYILVAKAQELSVTVWDPEQMTVIKTLTGVNWPFALAETTDGQYIVCTDNSRTLSVWDEQSWALRQISIPGAADEIAVDPARPLIMLNDFAGGKHEHGTLVDVLKLSVLKDIDEGSTRAHHSFSADGSEVIRYKGSVVDHLDSQSLVPKSQLRGTADHAIAGLADAKNDLYISVDESAVHVWNMKTAKEVQVWKEHLSFVIPTAPDRFLGFYNDAAAGVTNVFSFDTSRFDESKVMTVPFGIDHAVIGNGVVAFGGTVYTDSFSGASEATIETYALDTWKREQHFTVPILTETLKYDRIAASSVYALAIDKHGTEIALVSSWMDGFGHEMSVSKEVRIYGIQDGKLVDTHSFNQAIGGIDFTDRGDLSVSLDSGTWQVDRKTDARSKLSETVSHEHTIPLDAGRNIIWSGVSLRISPSQKSPITFSDFVDVQAFLNDNLIVALSGSNDLIFYNLATFEKVVTIVPKRSGEWIAYSPLGDYTASLRGSDQVFWSLGDRLLEFGALSKRFEHPSLLADMLAGVRGHKDDTSVVSTVAAGPHIDPKLFTLPYHVELVGERLVQTTEANYQAEFRVTKSDPSLPDPILVFKQQGRDIVGENQVISIPGQSTSYVSVRHAFALALGVNVIDADIQVGDATLPGLTVVVDRSHPPTTDGSPAVATRSLWYFGVGVDTNPKLPGLKFANKDVEDLASTLKAQKGNLFYDVHIKVVPSESANQRDTLVEMNDFIRMASSDDVVVIFFSGHGIQDDDNSLYFMTVDADPTRPYTGLNFRDVQSLLKRRPLNQKALLLLDLCHSGAYGATPTTKGLMSISEATKTLSEGTGLAVLASSTGRESSLEDESFDGGHGAFAAAILEALKGNTGENVKGSSVPSSAKFMYVTIVELDGYVERRVPEITQGHQHPTIPIIESFQDFPLAAVPPGH